MEREKIFPSSKKIHVSASSSLVDLKAELLKRKAEANLTNKCEVAKNNEYSGKYCGSSGISKKPKWQVIANQLEEKGELSRIRPSRSHTVESKRDNEKTDRASLQDDLLRQSRQALEAKAKVYEERYKKAREGINSYNSSDSDCDTDDGTLINFKQKVLVHKDDKTCNDRRPASPVSAVPLREDLADDDDWIVFTDSLGRSRRCLKEDFQHFKQLDEEARRSSLSKNNNSDSSCDEEEGDVVNDRGEMEEKNWEEIRPIGPVRYKQVIQDEVREHGVGFYMMSTDDEERKKQLDMLNSLRQQTARQREMREKIKEKRKQAVNERLTKVALRKGIQLQAHSLDSASADVEEQAANQHADHEAQSIAPQPSLAVDSMTRRDREALAMKEIVAREWDAGKRDEGGRIVKLTAGSHLKYSAYFRLTSPNNCTEQRAESSTSLIPSRATPLEEKLFDCSSSASPPTPPTPPSTTVRATSSSPSLSSPCEADASDIKNNNPSNRDNFTDAINEKLAFFRKQN